MIGDRVIQIHDVDKGITTEKVLRARSPARPFYNPATGKDKGEV